MNASAIWTSRETLPTDVHRRVLAFSPLYPKGDGMRYRLMDAQFLRISTEVTHWVYVDDIEPSFPPQS